MGKASDWIRAETDKRLRAFLNTDPYQATAQLNAVEYIRFSNQDKTKGVTVSGIEVDTVPKGAVGSSGWGVRLNNTNTYVVGQKEITKLHMDGYITKVRLLLFDLTNAYVSDSVNSYSLDIVKALGYTPELVGNLQFAFSKSGKHIVIINQPVIGGYLIPGQVIKWTWLMNYSLFTDPNTKVKSVAWKSTTHHSMTIPENPAPDYPAVPNPTPVTTVPQIPPGVPNPYIGSGHYRIQWELEDDPYYNSDNQIEVNQTYAYWDVYDDKDGIPYVLWSGSRSVTRSTTVAFRPRYCYNANFVGCETERALAEPDSDCPPYCSRINYGPVEVVVNPRRYRRLVNFLAGFIWDKRDYEVCPHVNNPLIPIFYIGYIGDVASEPAPAGQNPLGPGNVEGTLEATTITEFASVDQPFFSFTNVHDTDPTKDGSSTKWQEWQYPSATDYKAPVWPPEELDGCQPGPDPIYFQPPVLQQVLNLFIVPFKWLNSITSLYLWTNEDGLTFDFSNTKDLTPNSSESYNGDVDTWLYPLRTRKIDGTYQNNVPFTGADWRWYKKPYKYLSYKSSIKFNADDQTWCGWPDVGQNFGPFEWYTTGGFLRTGTGDITLPAPLTVHGTHRVPIIFSNDMLVEGQLTCGGGAPLPPIPLIPPLVGPFIVPDTLIPWGIFSKFIEPQKLQSWEPTRLSLTMMNDKTATVTWLKKKTIVPPTIAIQDYYVL